MNTQGAPLSTQFLTMPQLPSPSKNSNDNNNAAKMMMMAKGPQQWNNYNNHNNNNTNNNMMNFPVQFDTSLLGMAAASIFTEKPMFMQHHQQQQQQQQERAADARAITSQVLAELADDSLFDSSPVSEDIFDLEPVPIAENHRQQQQHSRSQENNNNNRATNRLALLEDTLNQVLSDESDFFSMGQQQLQTQSHRALSAPPAPLSAPSMLATMGNSNALKRSHQENVSPLASPSFKKQRTGAAPLASPSALVAVGMGQTSSPFAPQDNLTAAPSTTTAAATEENDEDKGERFRDYQSKQWSEKFGELMDFKKERGHCCVPHTFKENPPLARWVKRQRYQYKLKNERKPSTMTDERIIALERMGFVWDSHGAAWEERWSELRDYQGSMGHCNVPSNYNSNPQLATWVKCQRRQYKLFWDGKPSNMTLERISKLETLGFEWELRGPKKSSGNNINNNMGAATNASSNQNNNNNNEAPAWQL